TSEVLGVLGVPPELGRVFGAEDDAADAPPTAVLSHALWQARFGGETSVLGRRVLLDGTPHVVIGVMPARFHFPDRDAEIWVSKRFVEADFVDRTDTYVRAVGRLRPGVSLAQARAEMQMIA